MGGWEGGLIEGEGKLRAGEGMKRGECLNKDEAFVDLVLLGWPK